MALIKCPECGDQISDKSSACIHCGYPLYLLNNEKPSETSVENQDVTEVKVDLKEYSIKISNCNGSNAKVIITLKNKFQYSLNDAKTATMNLPLTVTLKENITEIRKLAQEFTDAGIDYEIFEGEKKLSFNLITKDKATKTSHVSHSNISDSIFKRCPSCGKITNQRDAFYCSVCNIRLEKISEDEATVKPVYDSKKQEYRIQTPDNSTQNENVPKCPTCKSTDIKKISVMSKAGTALLWGVFSIGKVSKQWHCNNCGSEW